MGVTIVTGAGSGIGRATAELLVADGGSVVAVDRSVESLTWAEELEPVRTVVGDVTEHAVNQGAVDTACGTFGTLDGVVFNAGIAAPGELDRVSMEHFDEVMAVNVRAVALGMKTAVPVLDAGGAMVVTASISGLAADPGMAAYNTSKGAVINLVRSAAIDLGPRGIRVNAVCPGPTRTRLTEPLAAVPRLEEQLARRAPLQRWAEPAEIAAVLAFLISPAASVVTGVAVPADAGISANNLQFDPPERP
ncbi:MAG: SDR family NAD(P)-dependent oxidoreductase [Acidimicrobiales bacterium]